MNDEHIAVLVMVAWNIATSLYCYRVKRENNRLSNVIVEIVMDKVKKAGQDEASV